jgi:antitoxin Phd
MTVYTFSEARQNLASLLERARREGAVRIKRRDGQVFLLQPERSSRSPLDVPGIKTDFTTNEIVKIVRDMRENARGLPERMRSSRKRPSRKSS